MANRPKIDWSAMVPCPVCGILGRLDEAMLSNDGPVCGECYDKKGGSMEKHFVIFYSPGTFVAETTEKPIESWDIKEAVNMAHKIKERHGATPYAFVFTTRARTDKDLDSKEIKRSGYYFLGGRTLSVKDIEAEHDPQNETLLRNMRGNGWDLIVRNDNSWRWVQPLGKDDMVLDLDFTPQSKGRWG